MIFRQAVQVNWTKINEECQNLVVASNEKENKSRLNKHYSPGDRVLIFLDADERHSQPKLKTPTKGPFTITQVHNNGTVTITPGPVTETINIHRIKPFRSRGWNKE